VNCYKGNLWSVTAGIGAGGFNAYIGFASGNGMIAGLGYNFGGAGGFSTNMIGLGVNWSESGGASANMFGWQMSQNGMSFNPGIEVSTTLMFGKTVHASEQINQEKNRSEIPFPGGQNEFDKWVDNNIDRKDFGLNKSSIEENPNFKDGNIKYWRSPSDGLLYEVNLLNHSYRVMYQIWRWINNILKISNN